MSEGQVLVRKDGAIGHLVFDNQARRNAVTSDMSRQLRVALETFEADTGVHLVVLSGAGDKAFVSGADIGELARQQGGAKENGVGSQGAYEYLRRFRKPTIAGIRGFCFGGGVAIAMACDLRFAAEDALFSIPSAKLGIGYRADFTSWVVEAVGAANAKEMLLTARRYGAAEALRMGLVHRVAPLAEFDAALAAYCAEIAQNAPLAMGASKSIVNEVAGGLADADLDFCQKLSDACKASEDYAEGRRAFMEKRPPVFRGV